MTVKILHVKRLCEMHLKQQGEPQSSRFSTLNERMKRHELSGLCEKLRNGMSVYNNGGITGTEFTRLP